MRMAMNATIDKIKEVATRTLPKGSQLLLYGSQARGTARPDSDWDLLILLDKNHIEQSDYDDIVFPLTYLGWTLGKSFIPLIYTKRDWESRAFMPFNQNVEHDKIQIL